MPSPGTTFNTLVPQPPADGLSISHDSGVGYVQSAQGGLPDHLHLEAKSINGYANSLKMLSGATMPPQEAAQWPFMQRFLGQIDTRISPQDQIIPNNLVTVVSLTMRPTTLADGVNVPTDPRTGLSDFPTWNHAGNYWDLSNVMTQGLYLLVGTVRFMYTGNTVGHRSVWFEWAEATNFSPCWQLGMNRQPGFVGHNVITAVAPLFRQGFNMYTAKYVRMVVGQDSGYSATLQSVPELSSRFSIIKIN